MLTSSALKDFKPVFSRTPGDVIIDKDDKQYRITIEWGDLQPGRQACSDLFYVGKEETGEFKLSGYIYAENLPQPNEVTLAISVAVSRKTLTVDELRNLPEPLDGC